MGVEKTHVLGLLELERDLEEEYCQVIRCARRKTKVKKVCGPETQEFIYLENVKSKHGARSISQGMNHIRAISTPSKLHHMQ